MFVTILVFLAALVQRIIFSTGREGSFSYNPCFSGSSSATEYEDDLPIYSLMGYNPCFSGSSSATYEDNIFFSEGYPRYNPCFSGSSSATQMCVDYTSIAYKLQSLFFWQL